jgi:Xaa-Pro dipeptidase
MHGEPMHSGIQDCWIEDARCAAAPRTVAGSAQPVTIFDHVEDFIRERGCAEAVIGVAGEFNAERLHAFLTETFPRARLTPATAITQMRAIKSPREVDIMRTACRLADAAMQAAMDNVRPGVTEFDLAAEANYAMFKLGAEHPAFAIAMTAGPRSGFKHMAPTNNAVRGGDIVYIDVGGRYMGYHSDCSRQSVREERAPSSVALWRRRSPSSKRRRAARPGVVIADLAKIGLTIARDAGYQDYLYFRGHGIGCATHDLPAFSPSSDHVLQQGMVFAYEPMLVRKEFGTACWEDIWHVTGGGLERLNQCQNRWW